MNNWDEDHPIVTYADEKMPLDKQVIRDEWVQQLTFMEGPHRVRIIRGCKLANPSIVDKEAEMARLPMETLGMYETRVYGFNWIPSSKLRFLYRPALKVRKAPEEKAFRFRSCFGVDWGSSDKTAVVMASVYVPYDRTIKPYILIEAGKEYDNNERRKLDLPPRTSTQLHKEMIKWIQRQDDKKHALDKITRVMVDSASQQHSIDWKDEIRQQKKAGTIERVWVINNAPKDPRQGWGILDRQLYFQTKIGNGELRFAKNVEWIIKKFWKIYFIENENKNKRIERGFDLDIINATEYAVSGAKATLNMAINKYYIKGDEPKWS